MRFLLLVSLLALVACGKRESIPTPSDAPLTLCTYGILFIWDKSGWGKWEPVRDGKNEPVKCNA
jgi:hypothetical protein